MADNIAEQKKLSVQGAVKEQRESPVGLLFWLANAGQIISPWWSKQRDLELRNFYKDSDHFNGATFMMSSKLASVPFRVEPRDASVKLHVKASDEYNSLLDESPQFGQGWSTFWELSFTDLWTQDNGFFGEIIGDGDPDGPIEGLPLGIAHLDSYACQRTSDPEFPVIYHDYSGDGKRYKFHYSRVLYASQMPSPASDMYGVGHCWLTRAVNVVQTLIDIAIYKQEKLGSRPPRAIITGKGAETGEIVNALAMADESQDNQGLTRFSKTAIMSTVQGIELNLLNLASLPDGFDEKTATDLAMYVIALAGGFPPRWLWPASTVGATKADAMYSHIAGSGGGASWHLSMMQRLLGGSSRGRQARTGKFLPPYLRLVFDYQDDEQDRLQADVKKVRSEQRRTDLETGTIDVRVSREQALSSGDLTQAQFEQLELSDGRLPDGQDALTLFSSVEPFYLEYLDLGIGDPLLIDANDPTDMMVAIEGAALEVQDVLVNSSRARERTQAKQALAALGKLKEIYSQLLEREVAQEQMTEQEQSLEENQNGEKGSQNQDNTEGQENESISTEKEFRQALDVLDALHETLSEGMMTKEQLNDEVDSLVKAFNYGARVGEVISGQLARGVGGRFASASEVASARNELLAGLIARLRARRGGGGRQGAAASARADNQAKIGAMEGVGNETVDALSGMKHGQDVSPSTLADLQSRGLAQMNANGTITMTTAGRGLLSAANTGDVDKAKKALADAAKPKKGRKKRGGGGGGKPKLTPEQKAAQKKLEEAQKREETFTAIQDRTDIGFNDMQKLQSFKDGQMLTDRDAAQRLEEAGFVELDVDGNLRLTADGRAMLSAGTKGDKRRALDVASRAGERKKREVEREEARQEREAKRLQREAEREAKLEAKKREQEEQKQEQIAKVESDIAELETELESLQGVGENEVRRELVRTRIEQLQNKLEELVGGEAEKALPFETESPGGLSPQFLPRTSGTEYPEGAQDTGDYVSIFYPVVSVKSLSDFRANIRQAIRGLWNGALSSDDFVSAMVSAVGNGFRQAFIEGIAECGFKPEEMSEQERSFLQSQINEQYQYIFNLSADIAENTRANGGKLGPLYNRAELWVNNYPRVKTQAAAMACADKKKKWVLGPTEHCRTCAGFEGRIYRYSSWSNNNALPQSRSLECKGYRCQCALEDTEDRITPGRFPSGLLGG